MRRTKLQGLCTKLQVVRQNELPVWGMEWIEVKDDKTQCPMVRCYAQQINETRASLSACGGSSCAHALLPLSALLCERTAIFTAAAEYIGDLRDKTGEHSLQHDHPLRQVNRQTIHTHQSYWKVYLLPCSFLYEPPYLLRVPRMSIISGMKLANIAWRPPATE